MALFNSFLFGNLHQRIDNLVMYTSRNQSIVRGQPMRVHNPRTPGQEVVRVRFRAVNRLVARLHAVAAIGFPAAYVTHSHNAFVSANLQAFDIDDTLNACLDCRRLCFSAGQQMKPALKVEFSDGQYRLESAAQNISAFSSRQDKIYVVLWESKLQREQLITFGERGVPQKQVYPLPQHWESANVYAYAFAVSGNGKRASGTVLLLG